MTNRRRGTYPYSIEGTFATPKRYPVKKKRPKRERPWLAVLWVAALLIALGAIAVVFSSGVRHTVISWLPFPEKLVALRLQHNGKEVILMPGTQVILNPRDSLQFVEAQTDGRLSWGTRITASDFDLKLITKAPQAIKDLLPKETFENPKIISIQAFSWDRPIGEVSFMVQLDARDWLQKASSATDNERKIAYLEKSLRENPGNVLAKIQLAGVYFDTKKYDQAAKLYEEIEDTGKSKPILEKLLAAYQARNRVDEALKVHLDLLKLSEEPEDFKEFVQYLQKHKSRDDTLKFLEKHQQDFPKAFQSSLLLLMADLSAQSKNWSKAAASYEKALKSGVKDPDVLYNLAVTYQQGDDQDKAIQALERYLQKNPKDMKSWMQLGDLQVKRGALTQARTTYETILEKNPQDRDALVKLVSLLEKTKDKSALQGAYEKLAQLQPKNRTVQYNLGILYYEGKKWDKAAEAFEAIAAADPKDVESRKYLLDIYQKTKNDKAAMEMLQTLAKLDAKNTGYYDTIFAGYDEKKDYKGMQAFFRNVAQQQPGSVTFHNYILYASLKLGDNKSALKELEELIRLQPKEKKHLRQAANLYETSGDYAQALKKIDQLLKLDPKDKEARDDYLRLKMLSISKKKPA